MYSDYNSTIGILNQIIEAINQLEDWNKNLTDPDDYLTSPDGMMKLAATSMLLEAIGESLKKIQKKDGDGLFMIRPEIPWKSILKMRNHIAHGYFDIDASIVYEVVKEDLAPLKEAITYIKECIEE
ncbi:MAG: DUF86 domain-containing protein [Bacteroidales bacterium]|nr:DUF86 domain-containing protein [Bacteroidales bacterium]